MDQSYFTRRRKIATVNGLSCLQTPSRPLHHCSFRVHPDDALYPSLALGFPVSLAQLLSVLRLHLIFIRTSVRQ